MDDNMETSGGGASGASSGIDIESAGFLEKFGCMQTLDHDDLVSQMIRLIGGNNEISASTAKFYLEMNMWNVQAAVCSYFDFEHGAKLPSMTLIKDVTVGEGEAIPPSTPFLKTWKIHNTGSDTWPAGSTLKFTSGTQLSAHTEIPVKCLMPWQMMDLSVEMRSPEAPGIYESKWRMCTPNGSFFGDPIFVILTVEPGGTMALTQQMSNFHQLGGGGETSSSSSGVQVISPPPNPPSNPFATGSPAAAAGGDSISSAIPQDQEMD